MIERFALFHLTASVVLLDGHKSYTTHVNQVADREILIFNLLIIRKLLGSFTLTGKLFGEEISIVLILFVIVAIISGIQVYLTKRQEVEA